MNNCTHDNLIASTTVNHLLDTEPPQAMLDLRVQCADCHEPFTFRGMLAGVNFDQPRVSADRYEARLPIEPASAAAERERIRLVSGAGRYYLDPAPRMDPNTGITYGIAHDRLYGDCDLSGIVGAIEKPAIPHTYRLCPLCAQRQQRRAAVDNAREFRRTYAGIEMPTSEANTLLAAGHPEPPAEAQTPTPAAPNAVLTASEPVVAIPEDQQSAQEIGQPAPAAAATFVAPLEPTAGDEEDEGLAAIDATPNTVITRPRPAGRNRPGGA